jgi:hypothetical protein
MEALSFYSGEIPVPLTKRDHVDPVEALQAVTNTLALPISAEAAVAVPEAATEHYTIEGTSGTYQGMYADTLNHYWPSGLSILHLS